jgi:hypothetical protein
MELTNGSIVDGTLPTTAFTTDPKIKKLTPIDKKDVPSFWAKQIASYMSMLCEHQRTPINDNYTNSKKVEKAVFSDTIFKNLITTLLEKVVFLLV